MRGRLELQAQDAGKSAFAGFNDGVGVMGGQPAQHGVRVPGVAQVTGAAQDMQARHGQAGRVADIVQPRRGFQEIGIRTENGCQAACPPGDALDVRPAAGQGLPQECLGETFGPRSQRVHAAKARQSAWDANGRGKPSEDVLFVMGIRRGSVFGAIIDRAETQVEAALREREPRLVDPSTQWPGELTTSQLSARTALARMPAPVEYSFLIVLRSWPFFRPASESRRW